MLQQGAPLLPVQVLDSLSMLAATSLQHQKRADQGLLLSSDAVEIGTVSALDMPIDTPPLSQPIIASASAWRPWVAPSVRHHHLHALSSAPLRRHGGTSPTDAAN